jgi:hypothetical protein
MATVKCYSGGKCVKTFKNIKNDDIDMSPLRTTSYKSGVAVGNGFRIIKGNPEKRLIYFEWRGDFLVEY